MDILGEEDKLKYIEFERLSIETGQDTGHANYVKYKQIVHMTNICDRIDVEFVEGYIVVVSYKLETEFNFRLRIGGERFDIWLKQQRFTKRVEDFKLKQQEELNDFYKTLK